MWIRTFLACLFFVTGAACAQQTQKDTSSRAQKAITHKTPVIEAELQQSELQMGAPVFIRIVKTIDGSLSDGYLELFLKSSEGRFELYKSWPICNYSGDLGPKLKEGDGQSPEGFYFVKQSQMNPHSSYHLSFNLGFPNAYDRANGRTGSYLMVHGNCVSIGCYAMTDEVIEEIYTLMSKAYEKGQSFIRVHAFPFPMTDANLEAYASNPNIEYWKNLKQGWDWFETHRTPPDVTVLNQNYSFSEAR